MITGINKSLHSLRITLLNIDHVHLDKRWNYDNVVSPFSRLYYIKSGRARVYHHDRVFEMKAGHLYLIPSFTFSRYKCDHKMEQIYVHFLEEVGMGLSIYNFGSFQYEVNANTITKQLCERLLQINPNRSLSKEDPKMYENRPSLNNFEAKNNRVAANNFIETHGILQVLLSQFMQEKNIVLNPVNYQAGKIMETLYYISANLQQELTVQHLAQRCHLNPDYFSRLFKEQIGIRPLRYLQNKRIERAQILISTTNHSLREIADLVGLPNISYFSRIFSKLTSKSPATYRKEHWSV